MTNLEIIKMVEECAASIMNYYASAPELLDSIHPMTATDLDNWFENKGAV